MEGNGPTVGCFAYDIKGKDGGIDNLGTLERLVFSRSQSLAILISLLEAWRRIMALFDFRHFGTEALPFGWI